MNNGEIIIYQNPDGNIKIDVRLEEETVWLTQDQMALLFGRGRSTVAEHIAYVYEEESWKEIFKIEKRYKSIIADESKIWKGWIVEKHRKLCKKNGVAYSNFYVDAIDDFDDYFNINKGVMIDTFYKFVLNDPNCESDLTGQIVI